MLVEIFKVINSDQHLRVEVDQVILGLLIFSKGTYNSFFYFTWMKPHNIVGPTLSWKSCDQNGKWVYMEKGIAHSPTCLNISVTFSRKCFVSTSLFSSCFANFNCGVQSRSAPNMYYDKKDKNFKHCVIPLNITCYEKTSNGGTKKYF